MSDDPRPCPNRYCRDSDLVVEISRGWAGLAPRRVECQCGAYGPNAATDAEAINRWNASEFRDNFDSSPFGSPCYHIPYEPFCGMFDGPMGVVNRPVRDPLMAMAAALAGAISLLEQGGKKAAPSDKMFEQMLADYRRALDDGRDSILGSRNEA